MNPDTVIANVQAIIRHFAGDGLTLRQYLEACLKQPKLFCQSPAAIIGHLGYLIEMYHRGLLIIPGEDETPPQQPLAPLFAFLSQWPMCLTIADDILVLRMRYAEVTGERLEGVKLLSLPRRRIEEALARALAKTHPNTQ